MKNNLYEIFSDKWLSNGGTIWIYSDPHFSDLDIYKIRHTFNTEIRGDKTYYETSLGIWEDEDSLKCSMHFFDEMQIKNINSKVSKKDTIIFLGDIGDLSFIKKIRGYKILIMGNHEKGASNYKKEFYHDTKLLSEFPTGFIPEQHGYKIVDPTPFGNLYNKTTDNGLFDEVYEGPLMVNDRLILSHEPIEGLPKYMFNIHGHDHANKYESDNSMNICAEHINYTPINLCNLLKNGLLKNISNIHRCCIDKATKDKRKKELRAIDKKLKQLYNK